MITLALVGYGKWGKHYLSTAKNLAHVKVKYVCTSDKTLPDEYIRVKEYKGLNKYTDIDGIIIATPAATHYEITSYFLKRDYNILVEKPFVTRLRDAKKIERVAKNKNSILMVGHIYLYNPAFIEFKKQLAKVGKLSYIDFEGYNWGPVREDTSALWDWAPHDISMAIDLLGYPSYVQAWGVQSNEKNSFIIANLTYPNDIKVFIKIGWAGIVKTRRTTVIGTKGGLVFDDRAREKVYFIDGNKLESKHLIPYAKDQPLTIELSEFISSIQRKKQPKTDLTNAIQTVEVITALEKSLNYNGKKIATRHS